MSKVPLYPHYFREKGFLPLNTTKRTPRYRGTSLIRTPPPSRITIGP